MSAVASIPLTFTDEEGNPLPPETLVALYPINSGPTPDQIASSGYCGSASGFSATLTIGASYRARFIGNRCSTLAFFNVAAAAPLTVAVGGYISPVLNASGYVAAQKNNWPNGWIDPSDPNSTTVAQTSAALLATLATQLAIVTAGQRLLSCTGSLIDVWAADFLGTSLPRLANEPDSSYLARIIDALSPLSCTLAAIATKTKAYLTLQAAYGTTQTFSLGTSGGLATSGGLGGSGTVRIVPAVTAFDRQSDPNRSTIVNLQPGQVCILLSYAGLTTSGFFLGTATLGNSFLNDSNIHVASAPSSALDAYVRQFIKSAGIDIVWADNRTA